jgi:AraC-like DNA-binding protein
MLVFTSMAARSSGEPVAIDEAVFTSAFVTIGRFRRSVAHPAFRDSGPIQNYCFVFPRTAVGITHSGERLVCDTTTVTLYNRGQEYERYALDPGGDRSDWFAIPEPLMRDAVRDWDAAAADDAARPIRFTHTRVPSRTYLRQRELFVYVSRGGALDTLLVDETALNLLADVLAAAYASQRAAPRTRRQTRDLVARAQWALGRDLDADMSLDDVASDVGTSTFHLCHTFRAATGRTLHGYRTDLRIRAALERLEDARADLTRVAVDLGFSSHSHFGAVFRRELGRTPSDVRRALAEAPTPLDSVAF